MVELENKNIVLEVLSQTNKTLEGIKFLLTFLENRTDVARGTCKSYLHYFMLNVHNIPKIKKTDETWEGIRTNGDVQNAIISAFDWDLSPEGYDFWDGVDISFRTSLRNAIHNGLDVKKVLLNDEYMQKFADNYLALILPKEKKIEKPNSVGYFPPTMPISFKEDKALEDGIKGSKHDVTSIRIYPTELTSRLLRYLGPVCTHSNKQIDILNKVLDENHCKNEFYLNLRVKPKYHGYESQFNDYLDNKELTGIVYWAFNWLTTQEGISFWSDIASKVEVALKKETVSVKPSYPTYHSSYPTPLLPSTRHTPTRTYYDNDEYYEDYWRGYHGDYSRPYYERVIYPSLPQDILKMPINNNFIQIVEKEVEVPAV